MPFAYYHQLPPEEQFVYRQSDRHAHIPLVRPERILPLVAQLGEALGADDACALAGAANRVSRAITDGLRVPPVDIQILAVRPRSETHELHGLYTFIPDERPTIQLWMRTARHRRLVAFRTFVRTLLHEMCHHLDLLWLGLPSSYHTEGFFKRESSLFHQVMPPRPGAAAP